jgi:hypothetical protein
MNRTRLGLTVIAAAAALLPGVAAGQQQERVWIPGQGQGTLTIFQSPNFGGSAMTFRQFEGNVRLPFSVGSVIAEGPWRLCSENDGRGRCIFAEGRYARASNSPGINFTVRSVVPQSGNGGGGGGWNGGGWNGNGWGGQIGGQSLRGIASQYWPAPEIDRRRVDACPGNNNGSQRCAQETAERFCSFAGWRRVQFFQQATVSRRNVLSDVLCTNR